MNPTSGTPTIARHKTAMHRGDLSRPAKCALRDNLISADTTVFDYGCGHGGDVTILRERGVACDGWDPAHRPDAAVHAADVVQLGYVLNVIEDPAERATALQRSWALCRRLLVVAAQVEVPGRGPECVTFGDGILTRIGTFQKYFQQGELKDYIEGQLGVEAVPAEPGIFYVFRDEEARQQFLATRYRRGNAVPQPRASERRFAEHREILEELMASVAALGRLPEPDEFPRAAEVASALGSLKRAFALVRRVTGEEEWEAIQRRRTEDYLVYLALARFRRRLALGQLPPTLQRDIRAFFGTYTKACAAADELLFQAGNADAIDTACKRSPLGKLLPNALYVHRSALDGLDPLLRVYEGCGRAYLGEIEDANVVKLHRFSGKISYLAYPDFDRDPHPALARCVKLSLRTRQVECYDYDQSDNPPILHRKEAFLPADHRLRETFARLTQQEERHGLLDETATIGTREGWESRLRERGFRLRGHRLVRHSSGRTDQADREPG